MNRRSFCLATGAAAFLPLIVAEGAPLEQPPAALAAYGDSITVGLGASAPAMAYAARVAAARSLSLQNRGISGSHLDMQIEAAMFPNGVPAGPVMLLTGYNDMRRYGGDSTHLAVFTALLRVAAMYLTQEGAHLYVGECLRMTAAGYAASPPYNQGSDAAVTAHRNMQAGVVAALQTLGRPVTLVSLASFDPAVHMGPDLIHPNDSGHAAIAAAFLTAMGCGA